MYMCTYILKYLCHDCTFIPTFQNIHVMYMYTYISYVMDMYMYTYSTLHVIYM